MWTPSAAYLFDTFGYVVLRGALRSELEALRSAVAAQRHTFVKRDEQTGVRNSAGAPFVAPKAREECGTMLTWPQPHCEPFRRLLSHPALREPLAALCGPGFRLDHSPFVFTQPQAGEGFDLHGGAVGAGGVLNEASRYDCRAGLGPDGGVGMRTNLLAVAVQLTDTQVGDGGFVAVPGSHKANFALPDALKDDPSLWTEVGMAAGDVLLFTEALCHGAVPWKPATERQVVLYRYAPASTAYGRRYCTPGWPAELLAACAPAERAVLEPPYNPRLDRPGFPPRAAHKRKFDEEVFGNEYF